ncbi:hypothetical protein PsAD2_00399 [Pseudovibrio axinellae]|uniref:Bacteriophage phiJL001 Gp84 C-terminal domain-containing protein n=1 Tax=Pseudovibrio axinellae TaxID=989403 RepID=A0A166AHC0_9HYPH|nr:DUF2163 domain-containing protein [Pseudovibrio axinellae]KZL21115.1 hypothetical protein PsAD2_00399 [Pseudovibrio axinellae]SEQ88181.1 phage conserved hypothetical protein BR0599 [Pseudovibrio axinellae]
MKTFSAGFEEHLSGACTTLCWCWQVTRRDGVTLGFTDHDRPIEFDGVTFEASSGFTGSDIEAGLGLAVDNMEVEGALSSDVIIEADIAAGLYDDAAIILYRVNWSDPAQRAVMQRGNIGEVSRGELAFSAEMRSLSHRLNQNTGRTFQYGCDAELGDERCGVNLLSASYFGAGSVAGVSGRVFVCAGLDGFDADLFSWGSVVWLSGANQGARVKVKVHKITSEGAAELSLWQAPARPIAPGDTFNVFAGCAHTFAACADKFDNALNYRGFPHMPGADFVTAYATQDEQTNDGSAIVK